MNEPLHNTQSPRYCIECYYFNHSSNKCEKKDGRNNIKPLDNSCEHFLSSLLFTANCSTCIYSHKTFEENPDGIIIPESIFYLCKLTEEEYHEFNQPTDCKYHKWRKYSWKKK